MIDAGRGVPVQLKRACGAAWCSDEHDLAATVPLVAKQYHRELWQMRAGIVTAAAVVDRRTPLVKEALGPTHPPAVRAAAVLAGVWTGRRWPGAKAVAAEGLSGAW